MFPAFDNNKWCYIDKKGNVLLQTDFSSIMGFYEDKAAVKIKGRYGFIDTSGKMIIEPKFIMVGHFNEGFCKVYVKSEWGYKWGVIDSSGEFVVPPRYEEVGDFSNGLVGVCEEEFDLVQYLNQKGEIVIEYGGYDLLNFSENCIPMEDEEKELYGYLGVDGKWEIQPAFAGTYVFSEGMAGVNFFINGEPKTGFIDREGTQVVPPVYKTILPKFTCGRAVVYKKMRNEEWLSGCIDRKGDLVIPYAFDSIEEFSENLSAVQVSERGKYGYIDINGVMKIKPRFDGPIGTFKDGLAYVYEGSKTGYINPDGDFVWIMK